MHATASKRVLEQLSDVLGQQKDLSKKVLTRFENMPRQAASQLWRGSEFGGILPDLTS
jgi:hypothetical protein